MSAMHGQFVWCELMTTDAVAATAFYTEVVGWSAADAGMPGMAYTLLSTGPTRVAGIMDLPETARAAGARPGWLGHIGVDDVDATVAALEAAGGTVHRAPADIPDIGRFAVVADPDGAIFDLFQPNGTPPTPVAPETPGLVGWKELHAKDWPVAFDFYAALFGWTRSTAVDMGPMGTYQLFALGGADVGGMMTKFDQMPWPTWLYYFNVDGIDAAVARVSRAGGAVVMGPHEVPGGSWIAQCLDPQGIGFSLVSPGKR